MLIHGAVKVMLAAGASVAALVIAASAANAQEQAVEADDTSSDRIEDQNVIIVSAQRRDQAIQDVPISIAAYSREESDRRGISDVGDIARITPNLVFNDLGNTVARVAIRGVDSSAGSGTTGIYINDVPIQVRQIGFNAFDVFPQVFDLERVEVLRGPQGTLFGAGSQGGTLRFITPEPDLNEVTGYGKAILSTTESGAENYEAGLAVGIPLVEDKLALRVSGWYRREGGFIDKVRESPTSPGTLETLDKDVNSVDNYVVRAELKFAPTSTLTISPSIYYQKREFNDTSPAWVQDTGPTGLTDSFVGAYTAPLTFSDFDAGIFNNADPTYNEGEDRFYLAALKTEWDAGPVTAVAVGSYFDRQQALADDFTTFDQVLFTAIVNNIFGGPSVGFSRPSVEGQQATSFDINTQKNYTIEARIQSNPGEFGNLNWQVGVFYSKNKQTAVQQVEDLFLGGILRQQFIDYTGADVLGPDPIAAFFGIPLVDGRLIFDNLEVADDKQLAGFAQADWEIAAGLTLTAGVRVSDNKFSIFNEVVGPVLGPFNSDRVSQSESPITPKFSVSYEPDEDHLFYGSASKGFRIGGANAAVGLPCGVGGDGAGNPAPGTALGAQGLLDRPLSFESDTLWNYEIGAKNRLFGGLLSTDIAVFHIDWNNIQQNIQLTACGFRYFNNVGSAKIDGLELSATLNPGNGFTFSAAIGLIDARFSETAFATPEAEALGAAPLVSDGDKLGAPPFTLNLVGQYEFEVGSTPVYIRADWDHVQAENGIVPANNPNNGQFDPDFIQPPTTNLVNVRIGAEPIDGMDVSLFADNLFDSAPVLNPFIQPSGTLTRANTFRPRTYGIQVTHQF
ncbi:MAG: TonB-dependent receptor [Myxococcota bacterium]|jgi:outer membrane receptor protein involved in Fe transport